MPTGGLITVSQVCGVEVHALQAVGGGNGLLECNVVSLILAAGGLEVRVQDTASLELTDDGVAVAGLAGNDHTNLVSGNGRLQIIGQNGCGIDSICTILGCNGLPLSTVEYLDVVSSRQEGSGSVVNALNGTGHNAEGGNIVVIVQLNGQNNGVFCASGTEGGGVVMPTHGTAVETAHSEIAVTAIVQCLDVPDINRLSVGSQNGLVTGDNGIGLLSNVSTGVINDCLDALTEILTELDHIVSVVVSIVDRTVGHGYGSLVTDVDVACVGIQVVNVLVSACIGCLQTVDHGCQIPVVLRQGGRTATVEDTCIDQSHTAGSLVCGEASGQALIHVVHVGHVSASGCNVHVRVRLTLHPAECEDLGIKALVLQHLECGSHLVHSILIVCADGGVISLPVLVQVGTRSGGFDDVELLTGIVGVQVICKTNLGTECIGGVTLTELNGHEFGGDVVIRIVSNLNVGEACGILGLQVGGQLAVHGNTGCVGLSCKQDDVSLVLSQLGIVISRNHVIAGKLLVGYVAEDGVRFTRSNVVRVEGLIPNDVAAGSLCRASHASDQ